MLLEFWCDKAFRVGKRLSTYVVRRNLTKLAIADLNVVTKDFVKAHPERLGNSGTFTFASL